MHVSLREADKIFTYSRLVLCGVAETYKLPIEKFFLLIFWRVMDTPFYESIKNHTYTIQELLSQIEVKLPRVLLTSNEKNTSGKLTYIIASLLFYYNFNEGGIEIDKAFNGQKVDDNRDMVFPIKPQIITKMSYTVI